MNLKTIRTERLILRRLTPEDFIYIFENHPKEEIKQILGHTSEKEFLKEKNKYEKGYTTYNRSFEFFQIIDKASMEIIGGCGFHNWYQDHRRAEIGYNLKTDEFKKQGIMSEALKVIIDYGFKIMKLHRIEALVGSENIPSLKLMNKFGFNREGVLKEHYFIEDKFEDSIIFGKLSDLEY